MVEWVALVVTGTVGVVGVAGTVLTTFLNHRHQRDASRSQRSEQIRDLLRGERRTLYIQFLRGAAEIRQEANKVVADRGCKDSMKNNLNTLEAEFKKLHAEMALTASEEVRRPARRVVAFTLRSLAAIADEGGGSPEKAKRLLGEAMCAHIALLTAMQDELSKYE